MSDKREVIFVPVDPETYGLGLALGCLIRFWPYFLAAGIVISCIFWSLMTISGIKSDIQRKQWDAETASSAATQTALKSLVAEKMSNLRELKEKHETVVLEKTFGDINSCQDQITVHSLEFAEDGMWLYFDIETINNGNNNISDSWLIWNPELFSLSGFDSGGFLPSTSQVFKVLPNTSCVIDAGEFGVERFTGYFIYPYDKVLDQRNSQDGILYLALGRYSKDKDELFSLLNLNEAENWNIMPTSDYFHTNTTNSSPFLGENSISEMTVKRIDGDRMTNRVTLSIDISTKPEESFSLDKPNEVYIVVDGQKIPVNRWNGVFYFDDNYIGWLNWYNSPWVREGSMQFDNVWDKIIASNCFDLYYDSFYAIKNLCIK